MLVTFCVTVGNDSLLCIGLMSVEMLLFSEAIMCLLAGAFYVHAYVIADAKSCGLAGRALCIARCLSVRLSLVCTRLFFCPAAARNSRTKWSRNPKIRKPKMT